MPARTQVEHKLRRAGPALQVSNPRRLRPTPSGRSEMARIPTGCRRPRYSPTASRRPNDRYGKEPSPLQHYAETKRSRTQVPGSMCPGHRGPRIQPHRVTRSAPRRSDPTGHRVLHSKHRRHLGSERRPPCSPSDHPCRRKCRIHLDPRDMNSRPRSPHPGRGERVPRCCSPPRPRSSDTGQAAAP